MFRIAQFYAQIYIIIKNYFGRNIFGLGFLLRRCTTPRYIKFLDQLLYFEPAVASAYGLYIINRVQEPETHSLLNHIFKSLNQKNAVFIEVGANIGAFMVDIARRENVHVYGFEPSINCFNAIIKTMSRNNRKNYSIFQNLVGETEALVPFSEGKDAGSASIYTSSKSTTKVQLIKIDNVKELITISDTMPVVLMIDVEGYEPNVIRGGACFIERLKPLIIFEYNFISKRYFDISEIYQILGDSYRIYRLREGLKLDDDLENAWNCVAIPQNSYFESILKSSILTKSDT
jgi:FkbM family methyltransferase